jgi:hypothetical protein
MNASFCPEDLGPFTKAGPQKFQIEGKTEGKQPS